MGGSNSISGAEVIIFDLDGTLTESKASLDREMASLLRELLQRKYVAVASGCSYQQFETQFVRKLPKSSNLGRLFLFPTCSASGYYYDPKIKRFTRAYSNPLKKRDAERIVQSFKTVFKEIDYVPPEKTYGQIFENRGSQLTFSALGQKAPLQVKEKWDPKQKKRQRIRRLLRKYLPEFEISIGGTTSIDVTRKGVNKTLCVTKLKEHLGVAKTHMVYVGDALFKGGNDYIMKSAKVRCIAVAGPRETKKLIRRMIKSDSGT